MTRSSRLLVPTIKPKAKGNLRADVMLLSDILQKFNNVRTGITMESSMFCNITPCSPLKVNQRFGGTCRLHLQGCR
jgi:hypothetical protein